MRIEVELTDDEFVLFCYAMGYFAGQCMRDAAATVDDEKQRQWHADRADRVHKLYQKFQGGMKP